MKDSLVSVMIELAAGNPGAVVSLSDTAHIMSTIPNFFSDDYALFLCELALQDIKGSHIYVCYSDLCKKDAMKFYKGIMDKSLRKELEETRDYKYFLETGKR